MKKRRKHQNQQTLQPGSLTPPAQDSEPDSSADLQLESGAEEDSAIDVPSDAELEANLTFDMEAPLVDDPAEMAALGGGPTPEEAETMDELLAELLALDLDTMAPAAPIEATPVRVVKVLDQAPADIAVVEPTPLLAVPELLDSDSASGDPPPPDSLDVFAVEPPMFADLQEERMSAEHVAAGELPAQQLLAAEPEELLPQTEFLRDEPVASDEPLVDQRSWRDVPSFDTADMSPEVEEILEPLPPQPALDAVVGTIDRALESAPAVIAPVETPAHHKQFSQLDDYIVFSLSGSDYAVPVRDVAEIGRIPGVTRIPNLPDFVRGITNLRGEVVPVLNLPVLLGLQDSPPTARGRIVFLQARDPISPTGLIVDEVKGIQRIQSQQLEQVTGLVDDKVTSVLRGVHGRGERLLNVLDLEQLFQLEEVRELAAR